MSVLLGTIRGIGNRGGVQADSDTHTRLGDQDIASTYINQTEDTNPSYDWTLTTHTMTDSSVLPGSIHFLIFRLYARAFDANTLPPTQPFDPPTTLVVTYKVGPDTATGAITMWPSFDYATAKEYTAPTNPLSTAWTWSDVNALALVGVHIAGPRGVDQFVLFELTDVEVEIWGATGITGATVYGSGAINTRSDVEGKGLVPEEKARLWHRKPLRG